MLKKISILSLLVVTILLKGEGEYEGRLEETVVTATGFSETIGNQTKNITIITREEIQNKGYNTVEEVLRKAPGINIVKTGFGSAIDVRGQGKMGTANLPKGVSNVKIIIDGGVSMDTLEISHAYIPLNTISVNDIERIEIINGGGTVLYGSGTRGGVINIITRNRNKEGASGKAYAQGGSYNTTKIGVNTGINLNNKLIFDLGYENINGKGYREKEKSSSEYLKGGLTFNITNNHTLKFKVTDYNEDSIMTDSLTQEQIDQNRRQPGSTEMESGIKRREYTLGYDANLTDNFKIMALGYKQKLRRNTYERSTDGFFQDDKKGINIKSNFSYGSGDIILGYEHINNDLTRNADITNNIGVMSIENRIRINANKTTNSVFLLNRHSVTDRLETTLGYRYEKSDYNLRRRNELEITRMGRILPLQINDIDTVKKESNSAYELGLNYKYSDSGNVYVKYERGFRSPGATEMIDNLGGTVGYQLNNIKGEKYNTYEIGFKDIIWNSFISGTIFYTNTKDEIFIDMEAGNHRRATSIGTTWDYHNIKETERMGFELFAEQYIGKFRMNESLSYVNAKIKDVYENVKRYEKGQKISYVPKTKITIGTDYEIGNGLKIGADFNYYSNSLDNRKMKIPSYTTTDLGLKYRHKTGFEINTGVKNVFNKKYNEDQSTSSTGVTTYSPAPERTYFLGVSYEF